MAAHQTSDLGVAGSSPVKVGFLTMTQIWNIEICLLLGDILMIYALWWSQYPIKSIQPCDVYFLRDTDMCSRLYEIVSYIIPNI